MKNNSKNLDKKHLLFALKKLWNLKEKQSKESDRLFSLADSIYLRERIEKRRPNGSVVKGKPVIGIEYEMPYNQEYRNIFNKYHESCDRSALLLSKINNICVALKCLMPYDFADIHGKFVLKEKYNRKAKDIYFDTNFFPCPTRREVYRYEQKEIDKWSNKKTNKKRFKNGFLGADYYGLVDEE